ncbi:hypothetical protein OUZ56_032672 [Daphnia magna]|uniref:Uncharacterized protein n=1 Tax=Daphnia magna TaxID=35525 RepID=A0ABR0B9L0_9CRUS|nr:hypothetical protein OUZ56_032672 [Daphnia magna]
MRASPRARTTATSKDGDARSGPPFASVVAGRSAGRASASASAARSASRAAGGNDIEALPGGAARSSAARTPAGDDPAPSGSAVGSQPTTGAPSPGRKRSRGSPRSSWEGTAKGTSPNGFPAGTNGSGRLRAPAAVEARPRVVPSIRRSARRAPSERQEDRGRECMQHTGVGAPPPRHRRATSLALRGAPTARGRRSGASTPGALRHRHRRKTLDLRTLDHDRILEPLRAVDGDKRDAGPPLFGDPSLFGPAAFGEALKPCDEVPKADSGAVVLATGQGAEAIEICKRLFRRRAKRERDSGRERIDERIDRLREGALVPCMMQGNQEADRPFHRVVGRPDVADGLKERAASTCCERNCLVGNEECLVRKGEESPSERSKEQEFIEGIVDGAERCKKLANLIARKKAAGAGRRVEEAARVEGGHVGARRVLPEGRHPLEEEADVSLGDAHRLSPFVHGVAVLADEPLNKRCNGIRKAQFNGPIGGLSGEGGERRRDRQGDDRREGVRMLGAARSQICRREGAVDELGERTSETVRSDERQMLSAGLQDPRRYARVELRIGPAEPVDALLRIADEEEPTATGGALPRIALQPIVGAQKKEKFRLNRIGILEFVDEKRVVARGNRFAGFVAVSNEPTRRQEEFEEVDAARFVLGGECLLVALKEAAEVFAEQRCKLAVGAGDEALRVYFPRISGGEDLVLRDRHAVDGRKGSRPADPAKMAGAFAARRTAELLFGAVEVTSIDPPRRRR